MLALISLCVRPDVAKQQGGLGGRLPGRRLVLISPSGLVATSTHACAPPLGTFVLPFVGGDGHLRPCLVAGAVVSFDAGGKTDVVLSSPRAAAALCWKRSHTRHKRAIFAPDKGALQG